MNPKILKKAKNVFFLAGFFISTIIVTPLYLANAACDPDDGVVCNPLSLGGTEVNTVTEAIIVIIKFLLSIVGLVSMLFIVIAGIRYVISTGNEEKTTAAKEAFTSAFYGIILALMAYGIIVAIEDILRVEG